MFSCGTGITPFNSILTNLAKNTKYKFKLFSSFRSSTNIICTEDLPIKPTLFISNKQNKLDSKKIQNILSLFDSEDTCILVCGTIPYTEFVKDCITKISNKFNIIIW